MTTNNSTRQSDAEDLLMEAIEVQLAALRAGIEFWSTWIEQSTKFSEEAIKRLTEIKANPADSSRLLLEITDASRESLRAMTRLPRITAESFIKELDYFEQARKTTAEGGATKRPKRAAKAKA